ncbi:hypothetical protein PsorP6_002988 [Peronosclerospora sorghi]|uniref:Uncharacterized protein n=1 Tax=Peronosclerospora sorghi TaxID=230839 RepID=A0ACC0VLY8_9STRA|nr:hypothetical protein PsorP6_002988 [Peronosclerospora sorghi]
MFSCYGSAHMILAFYSEMPGIDLELFDCFEADKNIESITGELHRILLRLLAEFEADKWEIYLSQQKTYVILCALFDLALNLPRYLTQDQMETRNAFYALLFVPFTNVLISIYPTSSAAFFINQEIPFTLSSVPLPLALLVAVSLSDCLFFLQICASTFDLLSRNCCSTSVEDINNVSDACLLKMRLISIATVRRALRWKFRVPRRDSLAPSLPAYRAH